MMDQQFLEREKELFRLNAKLNAKSKKIAAAKQGQIKVHIQTANNNLNHYPEDVQTKVEMMMIGSGDENQQQQPNAELMCKKMHITNQPAKKPQEIVYPLFNRQSTITKQMHRRVDIHMPTGSLISDGNADDVETFVGETLESVSFKNESMITKHSNDTPNSAVPPAEPIPNMPLPPPPPTDIIPKCIEKKISNDGLMRS